MRVSVFHLCVITASLLVVVSAWTKHDHEIFRLRDEIIATEGPNVTFYDFLGVQPSANYVDLTKAYRKKSKSLHPDKAKRAFIASRVKPPRTPRKGSKPGVHVVKPPSEREIQHAVKQATERFKRLAVVNEILRGPERERYDFFLQNGFPKWRGTGYYYSRYRPGAGTVLFGLFIVFGGGAHYGALVLSWKRQREFVDRYIRHARRAAWGDELGIKTIPGLDALGEAATGSSRVSAESENGAAAINRRQKRILDKENKKEGKKGKNSQRPGELDGTVTPTGGRKRVVAENGKMLIVDSVGNVFLEEETEDGDKQEFLLDINEIRRPTIEDTMVFRLPAWILRKTVRRLKTAIRGEKAVDSSESEDSEDSASDSLVTSPSPAAASKRRGKRG